VIPAIPAISEWRNQNLSFAGYQRFHFVFVRKPCSPYDSPHLMNLQTLATQGSYKSHFPRIDLIPKEDGEPPRVTCLPGNSTPRMIRAGYRLDNIRALADALHAFDPAMLMHSPDHRRLQRRLCDHL
jgi:hypothetical protein